LNRLSYDAFHLSTIGGPLEHSTRFVLVDQKGRVRGYYDSSEQESMNKLVADAKDLAGEGG
jgi:cytochrome oxidase Cu insertion factor (SCO1/SenC/PrrC family)